MQTILNTLLALMRRGFVFFNEPVNLETLREELLSVNQQMGDIVNLAEAEKRELSDEELDKMDALQARFKNINRQIETIENLREQNANLVASAGRQTQPEPAANNLPAAPANQVTPGVVVQPRATTGNHGFSSLGEFALAVRNSRTPSTMDPRLIHNAPTTYGSEGTGADGGFAVPPDMRTEIKEKVFGEESLVSRTDQMECSGNQLVLPKDETTPWQSSGGLLAYWESEGSQLTQSKPSLEEVTYKTNKLTALVPVTEELLEDAAGIDSYLRRKVPVKFDSKLQKAIVQGTGAGEPLGILNSECLVSVGVDSSQTADTIIYTNVVNMFARMYAPCIPNAVWLCNQDILPQLMQMEFPSSQNGTFPAWMPPGMLADAPNGSLMGRPLVPVQWAPTLGDKGDLMLCDLTQYLSVVKSGGIRSDVSMHLYFDYDMVAYRFVMRMTGAPWWRAAITPATSASTLGCFVALDARA